MSINGVAQQVTILLWIYHELQFSTGDRQSKSVY